MKDSFHETSICINCQNYNHEQCTRRQETIEPSSHCSLFIPHKSWHVTSHDLEAGKKYQELINAKKVREKDIIRARHYLAKHFLQTYSIITLEDTDESYIYHEGAYIFADKIIITVAQKILTASATTHLIKEVIGIIKRNTYKNRKHCNENPNLICLQNGILDLNTLSIKPHTSQEVFFNKLPVKYDPQATCPVIKKFLSEIATEDDIPVLQEIAGYLLYKKYSIHKGIMLVGGGANGKSTYINLLRAFIGTENCAAIPLQSFENNRFIMAQLHTKLANFFADLSSRALKDTAFFKMLTGEDLIPAEKKFKDGFTFLNYAKMIFSCNQVPRSPDDTDAFFRRWVIVNFPNQFIGSAANKELLKQLTTEEELSGFLNYAIEGLSKLLKQSDFSNEKSIEIIREEYIRRSDSVASFVMDCLLVAPAEHVQKKELYTAYCDYCRTQKCPIQAENQFHKQLQSAVRVEDYRPRLSGVRVQCWKGIQMNLKRENTPYMADHTDHVVEESLENG